MTVTNLTDKEIAGTSKQLSQNNYNVHTYISELWTDISSATSQTKQITFPFKIRALASRIISTNAIATTDLVVTVTNTSATFTTTLAVAATTIREKEDVAFAKDTTIIISHNAVTGNTTAGAVFMFDYVIDERRNI